MNAAGGGSGDLFALSRVEPASDAAVHVYSIPLSIPEATRLRLRPLLSDDECARADRFRDPLHGLRFTAGRAGMRVILGALLDCPPDTIQFAYGAKGKPALRDGNVEFNLSHTADLAVLAVTIGAPLGIDLERIRTEVEYDKLAQRYFSRPEREDIRSLPEAHRRDAFYTCWTRKEAYMKGVGDGFSIRLDAFRVSVRPDVPPALLDVSGDSDEAAQWSIQDVPVPDGYRASLALHAPFRPLMRFELRWR